MEIITARSNRLIVEAAKLKNRKYRDEAGVFYFEGVKLFKEALEKEIPLTQVFATEAHFPLPTLPDGCEVHAVSRSVYEKLTDENAPEGIFCVARHLDRLHKSATIYNVQNLGSRFMAVSVRDPGNLGTIMRTALAMGIDLLLLSEDCADLYNPRTIRGAMGALFSLPTLTLSDMESSIGVLRSQGYDVYATALRADALDLRSIEVAKNTCFVVGNEGHGLPNTLIDACDRTVIIPMKQGSESLNVASASSLLLWEMGKQLL